MMLPLPSKKKRLRPGTDPPRLNGLLANPGPVTAPVVPPAAPLEPEAPVGVPDPKNPLEPVAPLDRVAPLAPLPPVAPVAPPVLPPVLFSAFSRLMKFALETWALYVPLRYALVQPVMP